jgi:molybdate transport system substrate-binding protein
VKAAAVAAALLLAGCGGGGGEGSPRLVVSAAASMTDPLGSCSREFEGADVKPSFAGSDELAAQIRRGVKPDVYAAANTKLPEALHRQGLLSTPREFATNELVLAVPEGSGIRSVDELAKPGVRIAIGSASVPVGSYTREVLGRLAATRARAILRNVRSDEPDVTGVVGKLSQGAVDAGFVYRSDVTAGGGRLRAIHLPTELRPTVVYAAGVVKGAGEAEAGARYIRGLVSGRCAGALRHAGFGPPPE